MTWGWIDRRAQLRKQGRLTRQEERRIGHRIRAGLNEGRKRQATAAEEIESNFAGGKIKEAWQVVQKCYRQVDDVVLRPSFQNP